MLNYLQPVLAFYCKFHQQHHLGSEKRGVLRYELMKEENEEFLEAYLNGDTVEMLDACADMLYILCGTILEFGFDKYIVPGFNEVQRSNMSKLENGEPLLREDGKILKGKDYSKPNLEIVFGADRNYGHFIPGTDMFIGEEVYLLRNGIHKVYIMGFTSTTTSRGVVCDSIKIGMGYVDNPMILNEQENKTTIEDEVGATFSHDGYAVGHDDVRPEELYSRERFQELIGKVEMSKK